MSRPGSFDVAPSSADRLEQLAAQRLARLDRQNTPEERASLDAWLALNPRHAAVFRRLSVAWKRADALRKLAPEAPEVDPDLLAPERYRVPAECPEPPGLMQTEVADDRESSGGARVLKALGDYAVVISCAVGAFQLMGLAFMALESTPTFGGWTAGSGVSGFEITIMTASCFLGAAIGRLSLRAREQDR